MNAELIAQQGNYWFQFKVTDSDGNEYRATIILDQKGKFMDEDIEHWNSGWTLDSEGNDGDIREKITDYISDNWEQLTEEK